MTGTNCDLFTHKSSRSYLNHLVTFTGATLKLSALCILLILYHLLTNNMHISMTCIDIVLMPRHVSVL
jgi:hypothetical protein